VGPIGPEIPSLGEGFEKFGLKSPNFRVENRKILASNPPTSELPLGELPGSCMNFSESLPYYVEISMCYLQATVSEEEKQTEHRTY
jgi:hypothetical protein